MAKYIFKNSTFLEILAQILSTKLKLTSILQELAVIELNWNDILSLYLLTGVVCLPLSIPSSSTDKNYSEKSTTRFVTMWKLFNGNAYLNKNYYKNPVNVLTV